jgi:FAD/FMN-containing dehydrogenase
MQKENHGVKRRTFLKHCAQGGATLTLVSAGVVQAGAGGTVVNDIHSYMNATRVHEVVSVDTLDTLQTAIRQARTAGRSISIAGGRHAMGGQQFGAETLLLDMNPMQRVLDFNADTGVLDVEAGIQWPALINYLLTVQRGRDRQWGIRQKQTGADRLTLGGALAANVHGRGLRFPPIMSDVESFTLVDADGQVRTCSRHENAELFRLAIGGYGLFGIIATVRLRLARRQKLERVVKLLDLAELPAAFTQRIGNGFLYGDFQYATDVHSDDFLRKGVFACYRPIDDSTAMPADRKELSEAEWKQLLYLSHADKQRAFTQYANYYLSTSGQLYWSDTHQLSPYFDHYHRDLDAKLGTTTPGSEMISEVYVPRHALVPFLDDVRRDCRAHDVNVIYGTIRLIERDSESFLPWAKQPYACVIFNLHVNHSPQGIHKSSADFRRLIDMARHYGGSYFLTYHRYATRQQVEACYPQFADFLRLKRQYDPAERFQSEWYRHYRTMFAEVFAER